MPRRKQGEPAADSITRISVGGYKSIVKEQSIDIRPLTILAGANSSGKSSIMQPLLLMKQTLEAPYDPGALLLNGPNLKFTSADQLLASHGKPKGRFHARIAVGEEFSVQSTFAREVNKGFSIVETVYTLGESRLKVTDPFDPTEIENSSFLINQPGGRRAASKLASERYRCFLEARLKEANTIYEFQHNIKLFIKLKDLSYKFDYPLRGILHVPGLRGNPLRSYPVSAVDLQFPGRFEDYTASIIASWQEDGKEETLANLSADLAALGLTWKVVASPVNDTQVEIRVGRSAKPEQTASLDMVSIADVGFGVSQTLPVLVSLQVAQPGQLVYIEQPEIHLHPRAQVAMAGVLVRAARRGVQVVVETHSDLLVLGVQTLIANGEIDPDDVRLHWFQRDNKGATQVTTAETRADGSFAGWPDDFGDVRLEAQDRFLSAYESRQGIVE